MKKFDDFQRVHDAAIETIKQCLNNTTDSPPMNELVRWMIETDANPYSYLPHNWAHSLETATDFESLLNQLHHALYDDGDVTFVTVDGCPRIVFANQYDEGFRTRVLTKQEKELESVPIRHGGWYMHYDVQVLAIKPNEFGKLYDRYHIAWIKQCFLTDARRGNVEWTAQHYRKYKQWDESWIEESLKESK
jgi:hypothetical protein